MNIGIIVYSRTGHTLWVAEQLKSALESAGADVCIERVTAYDDAEPDVGKIRLSQAPDLSPYDAVLFGSPVHGFSLPVVMRAYMSAVSLKNQRPHAL
jgi:multimeric flavodoxin WrbA